jgi:hypothetical protein
MQLGKGIDVILSDRWAKNEQAIIDYGTEEPVFRPPSVYLGRSRTTLGPTSCPAVRTIIFAKLLHAICCLRHVMDVAL